ncbi:hypothetical protein AQJ46_42545 [Streptomyces canus]|uniref:Uncharacterized protein n=1 Tax=Streptomyces canus TaxID=58343 RepID=A0A101RNS7_9ACTN|nr:hypothetical protein AQJ46_42545 [Streptomyces canus]
MRGSPMMSDMVALSSTGACWPGWASAGSQGRRRGLPPGFSRRSPSWTRKVLTAVRTFGSWSGSS